MVTSFVSPSLTTTPTSFAVSTLDFSVSCALSIPCATCSCVAPSGTLVEIPVSIFVGSVLTSVFRALSVCTSSAEATFAPTRVAIPTAVTKATFLTLDPTGVPTIVVTFFALRKPKDFSFLKAILLSPILNFIYLQVPLKLYLL